MFATNHAQGLYRGIEKYGGGSIRELTLRCEAMAAKRSVWPTIQLHMNPAYEPPATATRFGSIWGQTSRI